MSPLASFGIGTSFTAIFRGASRKHASMDVAMFGLRFNRLPGAIVRYSIGRVGEPCIAMECWRGSKVLIMVA